MEPYVLEFGICLASFCSAHAPAFLNKYLMLLLALAVVLIADRAIKASSITQGSIRLLFAALLFVPSSWAATKEPTAPPNYDSALAQRLGGDEYGMRHYVFVILKTGPKDALIKGKERDALFAGHMANIGRLADSGKLAVAGPFSKNEKGFRGIFILSVSTIAEAQSLVATDPAVNAGILIADMTPWYGSASLMATPEIHKKIAKANP